MTIPKSGKTRKAPVFDLNNVTALLGRQLHDAMAGTNVPMSLKMLTELLHEIDRLRSRVALLEDEQDADRVVPLVPDDRA